MTLQEKIQKGLDCWCGRVHAQTLDECKDMRCPYAENDECSMRILKDVDKLFKQGEKPIQPITPEAAIDKGSGMNEKDFKLIEDNLKNALEYQENLNQQMMGRIDVYERIVRMMLKTLIDAATERR